MTGWLFCLRYAEVEKREYKQLVPENMPVVRFPVQTSRRDTGIGIDCIRGYCLQQVEDMKVLDKGNTVVCLNIDTAALPEMVPSQAVLVKQVFKAFSARYFLFSIDTDLGDGIVSRCDEGNDFLYDHRFPVFQIDGAFLAYITRFDRNSRLEPDLLAIVENSGPRCFGYADMRLIGFYLQEDSLVINYFGLNLFQVAVI